MLPHELFPPVTHGYLDCVGLVVKSYTATEIVAGLGCEYPYYARIASGIKVTVEFASAAAR